MLRFILRRTVRGFVVLFLFLTGLFFVSQTILPYDFTGQFIITQATREAMQEELRLNLPLWRQYLLLLQDLLRGELTSFYGASVSEVLKAVLPPTLLVFFTGTAIAFLIGLWLGKVTAWRGSGVFSGTTTFTALSLNTSFPPWLAFLMVYLFVRKLGWIPSLFLFHENPLQELRRRQLEGFAILPNTVILYILLSLIGGVVFQAILNRMLERFWRRRLPAIVSTLIVAGLAAGSWYAFGFGPQAVEIMHNAALPIGTFVLLSLGETMIIMQTSMKDTLGEDYVTTARAKGLPEKKVRDKHAARNALLPVFSRFVVSLPYLLTGMVIIERSVGWPGMGDNMFRSLYNLDMPVVMGSLMVIGLLSIAARIVLETIQMVLDPRIRERAAVS